MLENFNDTMAKGFAYGTTTVMWVLLIGGFLWLWVKRDEWIPISLVTPLFIGMLWITLNLYSTTLLTLSDEITFSCEKCRERMLPGHD